MALIHDNLPPASSEGSPSQDNDDEVRSYWYSPVTCVPNNVNSSFAKSQALLRKSNYAPGDNISVGKEIPLALEPLSLGFNSSALVLFDFTFI